MLGLAAEDPRAGGVERHHPGVAGVVAEDPGDPVDHLPRRAVGEGDREDLVRGDVVVEHEVRDPVREHPRLPRARPGEHEERAGDRLHGLPLLGVQALDQGFAGRRAVHLFDATRRGAGAGRSGRLPSRGRPLAPSRPRRARRGAGGRARRLRRGGRLPGPPLRARRAARRRRSPGRSGRGRRRAGPLGRNRWANWRQELVRFYEAHAPVLLRTDAALNAQIRAAVRGGTVVAVASPLPARAVDLFVGQLGLRRAVEHVCGGRTAVADARAALGDPSAPVAATRRDLSAYLEPGGTDR